jgi:hypothetical protein
LSGFYVVEEFIDRMSRDQGRRDPGSLDGNEALLLPGFEPRTQIVLS